MFVDGDLKRWIVSDNKLDSETLVSQIKVYKDFLWANNQDTVANIEQKFTQKIKEISSTSIEGLKRLHLTSQIK